MKRIACFAVLASLGLGSAAGADARKKKKEPSVSEQVLDAFSTALIQVETTPRFAFSLHERWVDPAQGDLNTEFEMGFWPIKGKSTVAIAADGKAAWVATDMGSSEPCGDETCPRVPVPDDWYHGTAIFDGKSGWQPVAWHVARPVTGLEQANALKLGADPPAPLERRVLKGAEEAVALFEKTIGEPKALAKTVSKRTDVVLYGSEMKERYVGGAKVAATFTKWNLGFKVRDGIQAGVTSSGSVAWVAANVDAVSLKKVGGKATPYRALFVYEKYDGVWQLVQAHFSFMRY
jgi:hypothetical protein